MQNKILFAILCFLLTAQITSAQSVTLQNKDLVGEKWRNAELIIPVDITLEKTGGGTSKGQIQVQINSALTLGVNTDNLDSAQLSMVQVRNDFPDFDIEKKRQNKTFYIILSEKLTITAPKKLHINVTTQSGTTTIIVPVKNAHDLVYTFNDYFKSGLRLESVSKVESNNNVLTVYGYKNGNHSKVNIALEKGAALLVNRWSYFWKGYHWSSVPISLTTIPFKVRPKYSLKDTTLVFNTQASAGLTNIGFNIDLVKYQREIYFATAKKTTHKISVGIWVAPAVEELDFSSTLGYLEKEAKSKQLFLSTAITVAYSFNDISFLFTPAGWDFATSTIGKNWVYKNRRWWGFGIAVSPKIFDSLVNK